MRAANKVYVVRYRVIHWNKAGLNGCANTDVRPAGDSYHCLMVHKPIDLDADVASGEVVIVETVNRNSIRRDTERIDGIWREQVGVTNRGGLCQIVETAD